MFCANDFLRKKLFDLSFTEPKLTYVRRGVQEEVSCILGWRLIYNAGICDYANSW